MAQKNFDNQDQKAKFVVKEMERSHGCDWACMVEPIRKFVQCFGVSKRPDQYIRLTCGPDRIRLWRITDVTTHNRELDRWAEKVEEVRLNKERECSQLIQDH